MSGSWLVIAPAGILGLAAVGLIARRMRYRPTHAGGHARQPEQPPGRGLDVGSMILADEQAGPEPARLGTWTPHADVWGVPPAGEWTDRLLADLRTAPGEPGWCEMGCGCRYGTVDPDVRDCACDGPCCMAGHDDWYHQGSPCPGLACVTQQGTAPYVPDPGVLSDYQAAPLGPERLEQLEPDAMELALRANDRAELGIAPLPGWPPTGDDAPWYDGAWLDGQLGILYEWVRTVRRQLWP